MTTKNYVPLRFKGDDKVLYLHQDVANIGEIHALKEEFDKLYQNPDASRYQQEALAIKITEILNKEGLKSPIVAVKTTEKVGEHDVSKWNFLVEEAKKGEKLSITLDGGDLGYIKGKKYTPPADRPDEVGEVNIVESKNKEFIYLAAQTYKLVPDLDLDFGSAERARLLEMGMNGVVLDFIKNSGKSDVKDSVTKGDYDAVTSHHNLRDYIYKEVKLRRNLPDPVDYNVEDPSKFYGGMKAYLRNYISFGNDEFLCKEEKIKIKYNGEDIEFHPGTTGEGDLVLKVAEQGGLGGDIKAGDIWHLKVKGDRSVHERPLSFDDIDKRDDNYIKKLLEGEVNLFPNSLVIRREDEKNLNSAYVDSVGGIEILTTPNRVDKRTEVIRRFGTLFSGVNVDDQSMSGFVDLVNLDSKEFDFIKEKSDLKDKQSEDKIFAENKNGIKIKWDASKVNVQDLGDDFGSICRRVALYGPFKKDGVPFPSYKGEKSYASDGILFSMFKQSDGKYKTSYWVKNPRINDPKNYSHVGVVEKVDFYDPNDILGLNDVQKTIVKGVGEGEFSFAERLKKELSSGEYKIEVNGNKNHFAKITRPKGSEEHSR